MDREKQKQAAAQRALDFVESGMIIGVGTGSTANFFIDALTDVRSKIDGAVASSVASEERLKKNNIRVLELNQTGDLPLYVDGADEVIRHRYLIKGGGGALTREKIIATASRLFICIADESKLVDRLGHFPLPVEVIPMARSYVARQLVKLGGQPQLRLGFTTDNRCQIVDVHNLEIMNPVEMEQKINRIPGVITNGLFALRPADLLLLGTDEGVEEHGQSF